MAATDKLSDKAIRTALKAAVATGKARRLSDGAGLHVEVRPTGVGWWRLRFWSGGKEGMLSLGTYPDVSLVLARERRAEYRKAAAAGTSPSDERKAGKAAAAQRQEAERLAAAGLPVPGTFEHTARDWYTRHVPIWSPGHATKILALMVNDLFPYIGTRPLASMSGPEVLRAARRIEARGAVETAYRALKAAGAVFRHGVQNGHCDSDPTRDLKGAIILPESKHRAAVTEPAKLGELLRAIQSYQGTPVVRTALTLAPLVFLRPNELRRAEWSEFDLDGATWTIPSARMKGRLKAKLSGTPHVVPLAHQAVAVLRDLRPLTGHGRYVFPSPLTATRPMSDNAVLTALRRMGFAKEEVTGHGFRATARTLLAERLDIPPDVIEAQLAHAVGDSLGRAYNRTQFLEQRRRMMSIWADYLDTLREGVEASVKGQPKGRRSTLISRSVVRGQQKLEATRSGNRMSRAPDGGRR
jgi:integrase